MTKKAFSFLVVLTLALSTFTSCEEDNVAPHVLDVVNNNAGYLGLRTSASTNNNTPSDGENDIDCFAINYPVDVIMPGQGAQSVNSDEELEALVEPWFENEANWDSEEYPTFTFPISVTLENGSVLTVFDDEQLCDLFFECFGEWDDWDDDECEEGDEGCECDEEDDDDDDD